MGFNGNDLDVVLQISDNTIIKAIQLRFLQKQNSWIFPPDSINISVSSNGNDYVSIKKQKLNNTISKADIEEVIINTTPLNQKAKYIRIYAKNYGVLPDWHKGKGNPAWLFTDEIILEQE